MFRAGCLPVGGQGLGAAEDLEHLPVELCLPGGLVLPQLAQHEVAEVGEVDQSVPYSRYYSRYDSRYYCRYYSRYHSIY